MREHKRHRALSISEVSCEFLSFRPEAEFSPGGAVCTESGVFSPLTSPQELLLSAAPPRMLPQIMFLMNCVARLSRSQDPLWNWVNWAN